jgi:hypothetical protein
MESMTKMMKLGQDWKPQKDVFFHRWGAVVLSGLTAVSAMYITNHFRRFLRLDGYARKVMYSMAVVIPGVGSALYNQFASNFQLALRGERCMSCIAVKNGLVQSLCGTIYPVTMTCVAGFYYAHVFHTLPSIPPNFLTDKEQAVHVFRLIKSITERSKFNHVMMGIFLLNLAAGYQISIRQNEENLMMFKSVLDKQEMIIQSNRGPAHVDDVAAGIRDNRK